MAEKPYVPRSYNGTCFEEVSKAYERNHPELSTPPEIAKLATLTMEEPPEPKKNPYLAAEQERKEKIGAIHSRMNPMASSKLDPLNFFLALPDCSMLVTNPTVNLENWINLETKAHENCEEKKGTNRVFHLAPVYDLVEIPGRGYVNMLIGLEALEEKDKTVFLYCDRLKWDKK